MWQRFTERARRTVFHAQEAAGRLGSGEVSPEHLLMGLIFEEDSIAARILVGLGVSLDKLWEEADQKAPRGDGKIGQDMMLTPRCKRVIDLAYDEARSLKHNYIGSEHLLLGLIREENSEAGRILIQQGADLERVRNEVRLLQDHPPQDSSTGSSPGALPSSETDGGSWARFTERTRRVVFFAQEEARRLGGSYVSTEHLLLGLVRENDIVAARILDRMGVPLGRIRAEIERQVTRGDGRLGQDMQLTPRGKKVIDLAYDEARQLGNNYIGTEHLLLGLLKENDGLAGRVLAKLGVTLERAREEVIALQDNDSGQAASREAIPLGTGRRKTGPAAETPAPDGLEPKGAEAWRGQSLLSLKTVEADAFRLVLAMAEMLKKLKQQAHFGHLLPGRSLALVFEKPSLRTRVSFEVGMGELGGLTVYLAPGDIGLGTREAVPDVAAALSRWVNCIAARVFKHETVEELAAHATVPVINALSDREHPCQAFADLLTVQEHKGTLGPNLRLAYVGDGNNVLNALLLACARAGVNLTAACPEKYGPAADYLAEAQQFAQQGGYGARIELVTDPAQAVQEADVVYTDVWTSMGQEDEKKARLKIFSPYQINAALLQKAKPDAIVLHCLPAHRGEEITDEVFEAHKTTILDQAENRLHTQKALLALILGTKPPTYPPGPPP
ncbi:MAG TPA: ornithine carbamoyltransferase [Chthonomonadaceae bacterium]|nr:ornithine carbamoyltransferase [Chthonomonadaceae bacterium]